MIRRNSHIAILSFALCISIGLIFIGGCAQENPLLYDPTMRDSSVSIRFVNMSPDALPKTFSIDGCRDFVDIPFGFSSVLQINTIDSAHYSLLSNGNILYSTKSLLMQKLSFFRNTIQTFVSTSIAGTDTARILQLSTFKTDIAKGKAIVRVVNACSDSIAYNVYLGCEQGEIIAESLKSGIISSDNQTMPGKSAITLTNASDNAVIAIYDRPGYVFSADSIYTIIIGQDKHSGASRLWILNELANAPLIEFPTANTLQAGITVYNVSNVSIESSLLQGPDMVPLGKGSQPNTSDSLIITTCNTREQQKISIKDQNGRVLAEESIVISPYGSYSCIFTNNKFSANGYSLYIVQKSNSTIPPSMSMVRTIASGFDQSITVNSAARTVNTTFQSGSVLFESIPNGFISNETPIFAGSTPLLIQTTSTPQLILQQFIGQLTEGHNYIFVASPDRFICLDDRTRDISEFEKGAIIQIIHAGTNNLKPMISLGNTIIRSSLQTDGIITSVIPINRSTSIATDNNTKSINATDPNIRYCFMIDESMDILDYSYNASQLDKKLTKIRIINLSPGIETDLYLDYDIRLFNIVDTNKARALEIRNKNRDFYSQIRGITYKQSSDYITIDRERRLSFSLIKWQEPPLIYASLNNVLISLGKNYCILLVPELNGTHRTIIRQEY